MKEKCVICFFEDYRHKKIRAYLPRKQKHLNVLKEYRNFIDLYISNIGLECNKHQAYQNQTYTEQVKKVLKLRKIELIEFIDKLIESFHFYIQGKHISSYQTLKTALDNLDLLNLNYDHNNSDNCLFFRARKKSTTSLTSEDMFHIRFTELHKVKNQRYSSTGHPFLYLGRSLLNLEKELNIKDFKDFVFSCFILKDWKK